MHTIQIQTDADARAWDEVARARVVLASLGDYSTVEATTESALSWLMPRRPKNDAGPAKRVWAAGRTRLALARGSVASGLSFRVAPGHPPEPQCATHYGALTVTIAT